MGDVVRPQFGNGTGAGPPAQVRDEGWPQKVYGEVGPNQIALYHDDCAGMYPMFKIKLMRADTGTVYPLAIMPATREGHFEAHAIASAVLEALRLTALIDGRGEDAAG